MVMMMMIMMTMIIIIIIIIMMVVMMIMMMMIMMMMMQLRRRMKSLMTTDQFSIILHSLHFFRHSFVKKNAVRITIISLKLIFISVRNIITIIFPSPSWASSRKWPFMSNILNIYNTCLPHSPFTNISSHTIFKNYFVNFFLDV